MQQMKLLATNLLQFDGLSSTDQKPDEAEGGEVFTSPIVLQLVYPPKNPLLKRLYSMSVYYNAVEHFSQSYVRNKMLFVTGCYTAADCKLSCHSGVTISNSEQSA
jgi:hypothetical protein